MIILLSYCCIDDSKFGLINFIYVLCSSIVQCPLLYFIFVVCSLQIFLLAGIGYFLFGLLIVIGTIWVYSLYKKWDIFSIEYILLLKLGGGCCWDVDLMNFIWNWLDHLKFVIIYYPILYY